MQVLAGIPMRSAAAVLVTLSAACGAAALEGDLTPQTRRKLERRITAMEEHVTLRELLRGMVQEAGLSVVCPLELARSMEPIVLAANDVTVGELLDAVAFCLHLEVKATPNGVIALRLARDDPRRQAALKSRKPPKHTGGEGGPPPELPPEEVIERVSQNPKLHDLLDRTGGRLFPAKFHHEKRVWIIQVRRGDDKKIIGTVFASEAGELVGIKRADDGGEKWEKKRKDGDEEDRPHGPRRKEHF